MQTRNSIRTRLSVESLEDRTVPTYFGASGGESIAIGAVLWTNNAPNDIITGAGPGEPGLVKITNSSNILLQAFYPFGAGYTGGLTVASADVTGDGHADLIVGSGGRMSGTVKIYEYVNGGLQDLATITPFGPNYLGGVDVAAGNVTGLVWSPAFDPGAANQVVVGEMSGGSAVKVYGYDNVDPTQRFYQQRSFNAFPGFTGGVTLAVADINPTDVPLSNNAPQNYASIITGKASSMPELAIWNAINPTVALQAEYMAFNTNIASNRNGINVAAGDTSDQLGAQIFVNLRGTGTIEVLDGQTSQILATVSTYPPAYGTMVNMAVGSVGNNTPDEDDQETGAGAIRDLVVVSANLNININQYQIPVEFFGALFSPACLNGSKAL